MRRAVKNLIWVVLVVLAVVVVSSAQQPTPAVMEKVPNRLVILYRANAISPELDSLTALHGARVVARMDRSGIAVVETDAIHMPALRAEFARRSDVAYVVHDYVLHGERLSTRPVNLHGAKVTMTADSYYTNTAQAWAIKQVGGYGAGVAGGPATSGPWDQSMGSGVTIAIVDSGVDATHPDIAPNLIAASSLVDQTALPSTCDDGSAQDQAGHGTWTASLAAAAIGPKTGMMVGVAPKASILSIKVLERVEATGTGSTAALCNAGGTSGLMSWVLDGIEQASSAGADIISVSAGGLLDTYSGESAGLIALFNRAAYTATQNGSLVIASIGNDGESLDNSRYMEMPAQASDVLPVMASTNPACEQNQNANASCISGGVSLAYYSNYGVTLNAVSAPGGSYPESASTTGVTGFIRGACSMGLASGAGYACFGQGRQQYVETIGTSASAPLVAGVAALLKGAQPSLSPSQIANLLRTTASLSVPNLPQVSAASAMGQVKAAAK